MSEKWDTRFMNFAAHVAGWSRDPSTQCGAVIAKGNRIISFGYNGPAAGVDDSMIDMGRDVKLRITIHAEANALAFAQRDLAGCMIYVWPMPPCAQCAAAIIQSGIRRVVTMEPTAEQRKRWGMDWVIAEAMYADVGLALEYLGAPTLDGVSAGVVG